MTDEIPGAFLIPPPNKQVVSENVSLMNSAIGYEAAWHKYILEFNLPKELEELLIKYTKPIVDLAAKTNILRREIPMHLLQYDLIWQRYRIFMHKGKFEPKYYVYKEIIRHALELQLNRSVDGWQGELLFTKRLDILEHQKKKKGRFSTFFKPKEETE